MKMTLLWRIKSQKIKPPNFLLLHVVPCCAQLRKYHILSHDAVALADNSLYIFLDSFKIVLLTNLFPFLSLVFLDNIFEVWMINGSYIENSKSLQDRIMK